MKAGRALWPQASPTPKEGTKREGWVWAFYTAEPSTEDLEKPLGMPWTKEDESDKGFLFLPGTGIL